MKRSNALALFSSSAQRFILVICTFLWTCPAPAGLVGFYNVYPIYLADGTTKASGSNYVVELFDASFTTLDLKATTTLLTGDNAGFFDGGDLEFSPHWCRAFAEVRIWDSATGTNFETSTIKAATSFVAELGGNCCEPPCGSIPLYGLGSICLGNPGCGTNSPSIGFGTYPGLLGNSLASRSDPRSTIYCQRVGELMLTNSVDYYLIDDTAKADRDYIAQRGTLTFLPGEIYKTITVQFIPTNLLTNILYARVILTNLQGNAQMGLGSQEVGVFDDRPTIQIVGRPGSTDYLLQVRWLSVLSNFKDLHVEYSPVLNQPNWQPVHFQTSYPPNGVDFNIGPLQGVPHGYYRAVFSY